LGTPISKSLGAFSDSLRTQRRQRAEEMAAQDDHQVALPAGAFHRPAMGIVLIGPAAISLVQHFQHTFQ